MIEHKDRVPTKPNRYAVYDDNHNFLRHEYHVRADEPTQEGNPINKAVLDELLAASGTTTGTSDALILAQAGFYLVDGVTVRFKLHATPIPAPAVTLDVNGTGAKPVITSGGKPFKKAAAGSWVTAVYSETRGSFILQGEGGGSSLRYGNETRQISSFEWMLFGFDSEYSR